MFRRYLREKHPPKGYTTDMPEDIFGCWLATWMRCVNDVSTYSSSHSSRHFLGGCCSRWICIWHFCSLSWVGCILSHVVHRYEILWGMWGSGLGDGLSVWVLQESESLHFILSTSHRAFFFRTQKLHCLSVKHKTEVQERKVPDWAVNCGPNLLEGIRSALSFSDGQQFVHLQPIYWVHWCMLQHHTAYILYDIFWGPPLHGTWAATGREGSNQDREGFVWRPGMEKCTEAIWGWKGRLGPEGFWDFGIERDYEYFRSLFPISPNYLLFFGYRWMYRSYLSIGDNLQAPNQKLQANSCWRLAARWTQTKRYPIQNELRFGELCSRVAGHLVLVRSLCLQSGWRGRGCMKPLVCHVTRSKLATPKG